ncbi:hypothetical protein G5C66_18795 [Nocardioides sp. KC13]|uniref:Uncharacterized protein n=1 Tax=Nocardioides turkmenicus TaxID=2711220 RepID=A0A6M1R3X5_9ACTN|nr:hypothetical protein [Nocardioides sp. KC13]NGN94776.1 hypothetical protein [Nocardioides sp. KC13]
MQSFLAAFLPILALMLTPVFLILIGWVVGAARDVLASRGRSPARER